MKKDNLHRLDNKNFLELSIKNHHFDDLNIRLCGMEKCLPLHSWGWGVRNYYLVHFVVSGEGQFFNETGSYKISKGQGFISAPHQRIRYEASLDNPWHYIWFGFTGSKAEALCESCCFTNETPVFSFSENFDILSLFFEASTMDLGREAFLLSVLYKFFSLSYQLETTDFSRTKIAKSFIKNNFSSGISVMDVAASVNLERKYFCKIFKEETGITPSNYILKVRMTKALWLIENSNLPISEIANSVGYHDLPTFSKAFKQYYGQTPTKILKTKKQADIK